MTEYVIVVVLVAIAVLAGVEIFGQTVRGKTIESAVEIMDPERPETR